MSREIAFIALMLVVSPVLWPASTSAETSAEGACVPPRVRQQVRACSDELGGAPSEADRGRSVTARVASRRAQQPTKANSPRRATPTVDTPTPPPNIVKRRNVTVELLRRELRLLVQLVDGTPPRHRELPNRLLRLAQAYEDLASAMRDRARTLDQPIFAARRAGDRDLVERLTAEQRGHEQEEVRWRAEAIGRYRRLGREFPDFPNRDEVLFRQGAALEELAEGEQLRRETAGQSQATSRETQLREEARRAYQELIRTHPSSRYVPHAYLSFAEFYFHEGDMEAALRLYERAAQDQTSSVYGYALYKQAWCQINLQHDREAVSDFVRVIQWADANPSGTMSAPLARSARAELIMPFSRSFGPAQAWAFFRRVGGQRTAEMMESLAQYYFDQGQWTEAITAYRSLLANNEASDHLCLYQARVADAVRRGRQRSDQVLELRRAVDLMQTFVAGNHPETVERECRQEVAALVVDVATSWHQEAVGTDTSPGTGDDNTMRHASELYELARTRFGDLDDLELDGWADNQQPTLYRLSYWAAELSFRSRRWAECGPAFDRVVEMDRNGEYLRDAAYAAVLCYDNLYQETLAATASSGPSRDREPSLEELQPRALTDSEQAMIRAFRRYGCHVNDGEDRTRVAFRRAMILYDARRFDEASVILGDLVDSAPSNELAPLAVRYHVDALNALRRLHQDRAMFCEDAIDVAAGRYLANEHIGRDPEITEELTLLRCGVRWFRAQRRAEAGDHAGCAEQYLELYREFGQHCQTIGDHGLDEVLHNAALCLESDDRVGPAIQVRRRLIAEYGEGSAYARERGGPSPLALRAEVQIGRNYHEIAAYTKAAEHYERFARQYPGEEEAPGALQNATIFWLGLGKRGRALEASKVFEANYGRDRPAEAATVAGAVGSVYVSSGEWSEAELHFRAMLSRYGKRAPLDEAIAARVNLGTALWEQRGQRRRKSTSPSVEFQKAVTLADRGRRDDETPSQRLARYQEMLFGDATDGAGAARAARRVVRMATAVAKARFYLAEEEYERFVAIELPPFQPNSRLSSTDRAFWVSKQGRDEARQWEQALRGLSPSERQRHIAQVQFDAWTERELIPWVKRRDAARARAEAAYVRVVSEEVPEWEIAAAARVGEMYRVMMQSFYDTPLPPLVRDDPELRDVFENTLNDRAEPYREASINAYAHCLSEATRNRWFNSWSRDCEQQLHTFDPRQYPVADEFRTDADHQGAPLATPQLIPELSQQSDIGI